MRAFAHERQEIVYVLSLASRALSEFVGRGFSLPGLLANGPNGSVPKSYPLVPVFPMIK